MKPATDLGDKINKAISKRVLNLVDRKKRKRNPEMEQELKGLWE